MIWKFVIVLVIISQELFCVSAPIQEIKILNVNQQEIKRSFFGINSLYWIDDDKSRDVPAYVKKLKDLKVSFIRYPGGEIADNFNWKTNKLNDPYSFPYSNDPKDAVARMDFDEFVAWKNKIGADAIIVVNLEDFFIKGNIVEGAKLAADWVKYANIEQKYSIKYWEIGNESYHLGTRYAINSKEYASALKIFSKKMKAVDPNIKIGAIGPWKTQVTPLIDVLSSKEILELRLKKTSKERKRFIKKYKRTFVQKPYIQSWWDVVTADAKGYFDFAVIHRYTNRRIKDADIVKPMQCKRNIENLRSFFKTNLNKDIPIALTEYNVGRKSANNLTPIYLSLTLAEMMGQYIESGVQIANYWPARLKGKRSLIKLHNGQKSALYSVYHAYSNDIGDSVLKNTLKNNMLYMLATKNKLTNHLTLFIINKKKAPQNILLTLPSPMILLQYEIISRKYLFSPRKINYQTKVAKKKLDMRLEPLSFTVIKFKQGLNNENRARRTYRSSIK